MTSSLVHHPVFGGNKDPFHIWWYQPSWSVWCVSLSLPPGPPWFRTSLSWLQKSPNWFFLSPFSLSLSVSKAPLCWPLHIGRQVFSPFPGSLFFSCVHACVPVPVPVPMRACVCHVYVKPLVQFFDVSQITNILRILVVNAHPGSCWLTASCPNLPLLSPLWTTFWFVQVGHFQPNLATAKSKILPFILKMLLMKSYSIYCLILVCPSKCCTKKR